LATGGPIGTEEQARQFCSTGTEQARQAHDLAAVHVDVHRMQTWRPPDSACAQHQLVVGRFVCGDGLFDLVEQLEVMAEHRRNELHPVERASQILSHPTSVAQDRHSVRDLVHLIEEVGHEQYRGTGVAQPPHDPEEFGDLVGIEAGGGFVEDEHASRYRGRPRDGDQLLQRDRMVAEGGPGIDGEVEFAEQFRCAPVHRPMVDTTKPTRFPAEQDVLCHGQIRAEIDLLVHRADARVLRLTWAGEPLFGALDDDAARVDVVDTGERLDQRGLARTVLTHQCVNLAGQ
jgi:hypothetical protein